VARRMCRHHLWGPPLASVDEVIRAFGAMQAQEFLPAKWAIAQRSRATLADVDAAFAAGDLLRLHILRPTWHFVHAADIRWMLAASAPRVHAVNTHYYRQAGIDNDVVSRSRRVFAKVLGGGRQLTRKELGEHLATAGMPVTGGPLAYVIMHAELSGVLVSGAMRGKQHTYALLDDRVPAGPTPGRDEALAELTRRFFAARGPATIKDYCTWASLTVPEARLGIDALGGDLDRETIGGRIYWSTRARETVARPPSPAIELLQDYDEYVMGYSESRDVMIGSAGPTAAVQARMRAMLLDGQLIGRWRHTATLGTVEVTALMPRRLTRAETAAMRAAVDRFGAFLGMPARWSAG
jgi:hypothetical protein